MLLHAAINWQHHTEMNSVEMNLTHFTPYFQNSALQQEEGKGWLSCNPERVAKRRQPNKIHKDQLKATKQATSPYIHPTDYASLLENPTSHIGMGLTLPKLCSATFERHTIDMIISGFNVV